MCRWVDGRGEERSNLYLYGTHARYLYIRSVMLCGTVQLWKWCHLCVIYDKCLLIQCMWLMQPLSGAIQYVMDQSQIDLVYWLMCRMLGSLMSNSWWPVGLVIGLQFNTGCTPDNNCSTAEMRWQGMTNEGRWEKRMWAEYSSLDKFVLDRRTVCLSESKKQTLFDII